MLKTETSDLWWKSAVVYCLDIQKFFDTIDHGLLMKAVEKHCSEKWMALAALNIALPRLTIGWNCWPVISLPISTSTA